MATASACSRYGNTTTNAPTTPGPQNSTTPPSSKPSSGAPAGPALASTTDIPVGGGKILPAEKLVLTQPTAGQFKAFSAVCTHAGCAVATIASDTINCPCHGSKFHLTDGSVAKGPATRPLAEIPITVTGTTITRT
ncbi:Rieske (2Fe-2S) protein [Streptomyces sp. NPDC057909]|uniref:Rieske (2Fe-2S) protein n=1 Tax=Streptomyces sp. NPDC057909 TaxID=3346277 RepID=UPI0036E571B5